MYEDVNKEINVSMLERDSNQVFDSLAQNENKENGMSLRCSLRVPSKLQNTVEKDAGSEFNEQFSRTTTSTAG